MLEAYTSTFAALQQQQQQQQQQARALAFRAPVRKKRKKDIYCEL
jgi:hypothetical protein